MSFPGLPNWSTSQWLLAWIIASHASYLLWRLLLARHSTRGVDADEFVDDMGTLVAAWTASVLIPLALLRLLIVRAVLRPHRLSIECWWGRPDSRETKGRHTRAIFPGLLVGTFTHLRWMPECETTGTRTNRFVEVGSARTGVAIIRLGITVPKDPVPNPVPGPASRSARTDAGDDR